MAIKTGSLVIEFTYEEEDYSVQRLEKYAIQILERHWLQVEEIKHIEAAPGTLTEAFGVEGWSDGAEEEE